MENRRNSAFTLVELLVVVTIIIVLLALLTPSLDRAIEQAERVRCAANLHAWGAAHAQYYIDFKRKLLSTMRTNSQYPNPNFCWGESQRAVFQSSTADWDFSARAMLDYVPNTDVATYQMKGIWKCPSNNAPLKDEVSARTAMGTGGLVATSGYFQPDYAYFARGEAWADTHATRPDRITRRDPVSNRLLMADVIWRWRVNQTWYYNHGVNGYSVHDAAWGGPVASGVPEITGANQMYGDGSTGWKDGNEFDPELMEQVAPEIPWSSHQQADGSPDPTGDITYY